MIVDRDTPHPVNSRTPNYWNYRNAVDIGDGATFAVEFGMGPNAKVWLPGYMVIDHIGPRMYGWMKRMHTDRYNATVLGSWNTGSSYEAKYVSKEEAERFMRVVIEGE